MMESQPVRFIEKLQTYLSTLADLQEREGRRIEEELHRLGRSWRIEGLKKDQA